MHQVTGPFGGHRRLASSPESGPGPRHKSAVTINQQTAAYLQANLYQSRSTNLIARNPFPKMGMCKKWPTMSLPCHPVAAAYRADLGVVRPWDDVIFANSEVQEIPPDRTK